MFTELIDAKKIPTKLMIGILEGKKYEKLPPNLTKAGFQLCRQLSKIVTFTQVAIHSRLRHLVSSQRRIRTFMKSMYVFSSMGLPQGFPPAIARSSVYHFAT